MKLSTLCVVILAMLFSVTGGVAHATAVLKAEYHFNEGSGTTAYDETGMFDGTIIGATYSPNTPCGASGAFSLFFDGNSHVDIGPSSNFAFSSISVELWLYPTTDPIPAGTAAFAVGQLSSNHGLQIHRRGSNESEALVGQVGDGTHDSFLNLRSHPVPVDTWTHVALTFDGTTNMAKLYIDGAMVDSLTQNAILYQTGLPARIGALSDRFPSVAWVGFIDNVRVYEGVRTDGEIAQAATCTSILEVEIDIKPGSDPNCFNNDGNGVIPVAIIGSASFDVSQVDGETIELAGMPVAVKGKSNKLLARVENTNGDVYDDLVVQIEDLDSVFSEGDTTATLTGNLKEEFGGTSFSGVDTICIVGPPSAPSLTPQSKLTTMWAKIKADR